MDAKLKARYAARAEIIKAMAHPTRLFIVDELSRGERCVAELTEMVEVDMSTISRHLSILRNAGILRDERRGTSIYYHLRYPCVLGFFSCVESVMESSAKETIDLSCGSDR